MNSNLVWGPQSCADGGGGQGCPSAAGAGGLDVSLTLLPLQPEGLQDSWTGT